MSQQDNRRGSGVQNRDPNAFLQAFMNLFSDTSKTEAAKRRQEMLYEKKYGKKPQKEQLPLADLRGSVTPGSMQPAASNLGEGAAMDAAERFRAGTGFPAGVNRPSDYPIQMAEPIPETAKPKVDFNQSEPVSGGSKTVVPTFTMADLVGSDIEVGDMFAPPMKMGLNDEIAQAFLAEKMPVKNPEPVKKAKEPHPLSHFYPNRHQFK